jgi:hypothetical protein
MSWPKIRRAAILTAGLTAAGLLFLPGAPATAAERTIQPAGHLGVIYFGDHPGFAKRPDRVVMHNPTRDMAAHLLAKQRAAVHLHLGSTAINSTAGRGLFNNLNQPGLGVGDEGFCCVPPDPTGAIGPNHYVEMVNSLIGVYDRNNLSLLSSMDSATFVAASGGTISDPQIEYDFVANRWFYLAVDFDIANNNNFLVFGWSKTSDPSDLTNGWCRFGVYTGRTINDFPKLGHDNNYMLFGSNLYDDADLNTEISGQIWAYRKPANGDASCTGTGPATYFADAAHVLHNADDTPADTPVPVNTTESSTGGYIVAAHSPLTAPAGPRSKIMVWHMTMQASSPVLVADGDITVNSYDVPADVPQPQNSLDTLDGQLTQAVGRRDPDAGAFAVWTQHTIAGAGGLSVVRWYELLPESLSVRQEGSVASATNFIFNGAISTSTNGNDAVVEYNSASSSQTPTVAAQSRQGSTPLGSMDAGEVVLASSTDVDVDFSCGAPYGPPCRWGDYSGATPDPVNAGVVWGSNMFTGLPSLFGFPQWTTQNFALATGGTVASDFSLSVAPANQAVNPGGSTSYTVTITPSGGFSGSVTLAVTGLPGGASGTFNPNPATSSSTLAVTTDSSTAASSYSFTVTGTSGSLSHTASGTLVVNAPPPPDFSLTASPSSRVIGPGPAGTSYSVTITALNGFNGGVALSLAGLPVGATGSFTPNPATTAATLNVTIDTTTPAGSYVLTITGTSGSLSHTTTVTLTVNGDFSLSASPSSASVTAGGRATYTVTVTQLNGFTGSVTLSASGLPAKASASFSPDLTSSSSTLTIRTNRGQTPAGTYTITITGTSGGVAHAVTVTLVVT